jgi:hypothetical protein
MSGKGAERPEKQALLAVSDCTTTSSADLSSSRNQGEGELADGVIVKES